MATGANALAKKLLGGTTLPAKPKQQPIPAKSPTKKVAAKPAKSKPATRKFSGKRGTIMESLRPRILAMEKSGKSLSAIADELGLSNSYVWVIARNYKYDPDGKKAPRKKNNVKSKNNLDEQ